MPSADGVLVAAVGLVLTGAGLPEAAGLPSGDGTGTGFVAVPAAGASAPRAVVSWYEDGTLAGGADGPEGKLRDCEQAMRRAGFHVEYSTEITGGRLLAWLRTRT